MAEGNEVNAQPTTEAAREEDLDRTALALVNVVDGTDIGMVQGRSCAGFPLEALQRGVIVPLGIIVYVFNAGQVPLATLRRAESNAARIIGKAEVRSQRT